MYVKNFGSGDDIYAGDEGPPNTAPGAPTDSDSAANILAEGAATGAAIAGLALGAFDPDAGQILIWSLLDDADGRFAIDAATGVVTVADASKLNFETATSHQIIVQVSDGTATSSASFTIDVANVAPSAPADLNPDANTVSEDAANGAVVTGLTIAAADPNGGLSYSLIDDAGGRFAIDAATGVVTVVNASLLDYDAAASHQITVRASDGTADAATDTTFTIEVVNAAPTTPTDADTAINAVSEGAANGDLVGVTASASEPKTGAVTYSLADDAGGRFAIDGATGVVTVADATKLNFETAASHQITVHATDAQGAFSSQAFTIAVTNDANDAPADGDSTANTISEGATNGAVVAGLSISAADVNGGPLVYSLLDNAGGRFAINASTGVVTVANANLLNYEAATSHQIIVQAGSGSASASAAFTIDVLNAAPATPTDTNGAPTLVSEHATTGTVVGGLSIAAPDPHGGTVTYSLTNDAGGRFAINATTGVVTVANASLLDHDTQASQTITVQASDGSLASMGNVVVNLIDEIDTYWTGTTGNDAFTVPDVQDWQLSGGVGRDTLTGGVGDDIIIGGYDDDTLIGGAGNDTFLIGRDEGWDAVDGGSGTDTIRFTASNAVVNFRSLAGIEAVNTGGFTNVGFLGGDRNDLLDFSGVTSTGTITIAGGEGHDTIYGTNGPDLLYGQNGNDTIFGLDGADTIVGGAGNNALYGGGGGDLFLIDDSSGQNVFDGGAGYDEIRATTRNTMIAISTLTGIEKISSGGFANVQIGLANLLSYANWDFTNVELSGITLISGGVQADTIIGGAGNDVIFGNPGPDTLKGGLGDDTFLYGLAESTLRFDTVDGGAGWDKLLANANGATFEIASMAGIEEISTGGFSGVNLVSSTAADTIDLRSVVVTGSLNLVHLNGGDDTFYGTAGADVVDGGTGNDYIDTGAGDDTILVNTNQGLDVIHAGSGYDKLVSTDSNVWIIFNTFDGIEEIQGVNIANTKIVGTANDDVIDLRNIVVSRVEWISGDDGNDTIYGSQGADNLIGAAGTDTIYGAGGDDKISFYQGAGTDVVDGGAGYDTLVAASDYAIIGISAMTSIEAITAESVNGTSHTGMAFTDNADNFDLSAIAVSGITFTDLKAGDDIFVGSSAGERIIGGLGHDTVTGGGGADNFDFNAVAEIDHDVIIDFLSGTDRIDLSTIDARTNVNEDQSFTLIGTSGFTGVSGQLRYDVSGGVATVQGDVNGDGLADFYIHVNGVSSLTSADFFL
ncbi:beta strand repeat-containing protein [Caulobacter sp. LARHSG274]